MTIFDVLRQYNLTIPQDGASCHLNTTPWKAYDFPPTGEIVGLPSLRGKLVASNGVLGILIRPDQSWKIVHPTNFVPDDIDLSLDEPTARAREGQTMSKPRKSKLLQALEAYV